MNCSDLNSHLFNLHVFENEMCAYCHDCVEDTYHFFIKCPLYNLERNDLFNKIFNIHPIVITLSVLLFGSSELEVIDNLALFSFVEKFIKDSGRFKV